MSSDYNSHIRIIKESRKTISIRIQQDGTVEVKAPRYVSRATVLSFIESKRGWIEKKLAQAARQQRELMDSPPLDEAGIRKLAREARKVFPERCAYYAPLVGTDYGRITIRRQQSRFGSCSAKGNLNFNLALMLAPPEVLDYVVVHELCHRLEMNHSERFWGHVARVIPAYKSSKQWLKQHGSVLISRVNPPEGSGRPED